MQTQMQAPLGSLLLLLSTLWLALGSSCASPSGGSAPQASGPVPTVMVLVDHRNDMRMTLISDAWLRDNNVPGDDFAHRRAAYYSQRLKGDNSKVKIIQDEVAQGFWKTFQEQGFERYGRNGTAPPKGGEVASSIEVSLPGQQIHMGGYPDMTQEEVIAYRECKLIFMDLYNFVPQMQAVDRMPTFHSAKDNQR